MTFEEMAAVARKIENALRAEGFDARYMSDVAEPGEDLPISVVVNGEDFVLGLNLL